MIRQLTQTVRIEIHRINEEASEVLVQLHSLIPSCPSNLSDLATTVTVAYDNAEATAPSRVLLKVAYLRARTAASELRR